MLKDPGAWNSPGKEVTPGGSGQRGEVACLVAQARGGGRAVDQLHATAAAWLRQSFAHVHGMNRKLHLLMRCHPRDNPWHCSPPTQWAPPHPFRLFASLSLTPETSVCFPFLSVSCFLPSLPLCAAGPARPSPTLVQRIPSLPKPPNHEPRHPDIVNALAA